MSISDRRRRRTQILADSLVEGTGFEPPVPRKTPGLWPISTRTTRRDGSRKREFGSDSRLLAPPCGGSGGLGCGCAFRFRPPGTGSKRAGWRRSGAILFAFLGVCFEPDASRARLRFKAAMRSMTGGGAAISLGLTVSPFILASSSSRKASW